MVNQRLHKQRGAAIIVALFVVALVAAASTIMLEQLRIDIRRTQLILDTNKAYLLAQGSIAWAMDQLTQNNQKAQPNTLVDHTPIYMPRTEVQGAKISSILKDAQGFFNINNINEPNYQTNFTRLIRVMDPSLDSAIAEDITLSATDWIFTGAKTPGLDEYYLKMNPSYRAAHRLMVSPSEFRMVKGVTAKLYTQMAPYLIALPATTPININNTEAPVLMSLSMTLSADTAKALVNLAKKTPFKNKEAFLSTEIIKQNPIDAAKITTVSSYFLLETNVTLGNQHLTFYTLLQRTGQGKETKIVMLWQNQGTL